MSQSHEPAPELEPDFPTEASPGTRIVPASDLPPPPPPFTPGAPEQSATFVISPTAETVEQQVARLEAELQSMRDQLSQRSGVSWTAVILLTLVPLLVVGALGWWWRPRPPAEPVVPPTTLLTQQKLTFHKWKKGQPAVRLIRAEEGFCFLTSVRGHFQGGGESVYVRIQDDGWWHFGGSAATSDLYAECAVYRFDSHPAQLR